jgi:hypothetical protein
MVIEIIEVYDVCWIYLAQDSDHWWASCVHEEMCQISLQCEGLLALQELLWSMN